MFKPFPTSLGLALCTSLLLADPSEQRIGGDNPRDTKHNYYLDPDDPYAVVTSGDSELGVQRILRPPSPNPLSLRASAEVFALWSDNAAYTDEDEIETTALGARVGVHGRLRLGKKIFLEGYGYQDLYRYEESDLDYESTEFGLGFLAPVPALGDLVFFGRYEFLYVRSDNFAPLPGDSRDNIHTRLHRVRTGAGKTILEGAKYAFYLSGDVRFDLDANAAELKRTQYTARTSFVYRITQKLEAAAYYQASYRDYRNSSRQDWNNSVGAELSYSLSNWATLYASSFYTFNDSNETGGDYEALEGGVLAGFLARF